MYYNFFILVRVDLWCLLYFSKGRVLIPLIGHVPNVCDHWSLVWLDELTTEVFSLSC